MREVNIFGPVNTLGFGVWVTNTVDSLITTGAKVNLTALGQQEYDDVTEFNCKKAINNLPNFSSKNPSVFMFHDGYANQFSGSPRIIGTMFETTKLQPLSVKMINDCDIVLAPTEDHKLILENNNIIKPIKVVPLGVNPKIFNSSISEKYINTDKFTFITVGKTEKRKNTSEIIKSFVETLGTKEVALICHTFNPFIGGFTDINLESYGYKACEKTDRYIKVSNGISDVYFTKSGVKSSDLKKLYHSANVGIQCSSAEGWGLPTIELMACGIPTIVTNCIGHKEFLKDTIELQKGLILDIQEDECAIDGIWFNGKQGNWKKLNSKDLRNKLEDVYEDRNEYYKVSNSLSDYYREKFSWEKSVTKLISII